MHAHAGICWLKYFQSDNNHHTNFNFLSPGFHKNLQIQMYKEMISDKTDQMKSIQYKSNHNYEQILKTAAMI